MVIKAALLRLDAFAKAFLQVLLTNLREHSPDDLWADPSRLTNGADRRVLGTTQVLRAEAVQKLANFCLGQFLGEKLLDLVVAKLFHLPAYDTEEISGRFRRRNRRTVKTEMHKLKKGGSPTFSHDGKLVAACGSSPIYIYDTKTGDLLTQTKALSNQIYMAFDPTGTKLAVKSTSGRIAIVSISGDVIADFKNQSEGEGSNILWTPDGRHLIDGSWNGLLRKRNAETGEIVAQGFAAMPSRLCWTVDGDIAVEQTRRGDPPIYRMGFFDADLNPLGEPTSFEKGKLNAFVNPAKSHTMWFENAKPARIVFQNIESGELSQIEAPSGSTNKIYFSPDGQSLASGNFEGEWRIYRFPSLDMIRSFDVPYPQQAAYSDDGKQLCLGGWTYALLVEVDW